MDGGRRLAGELLVDNRLGERLEGALRRRQADARRAYLRDDPARGARPPSRGARLRRAGSNAGGGAARGSASVTPSIASIVRLVCNAAVRREASRASSRREHAVARHDDRERVLAHGLPDRARSARRAHARRELAVTDGLPRSHATQRLVDAPVKERHAPRSRARAPPARPSVPARCARIASIARLGVAPRGSPRAPPGSARASSRASPRRPPRGAAPPRGRVRSTRHRSGPMAVSNSANEVRLTPLEHSAAILGVMLTLHLVRHGDTAQAAEGYFAGDIDPPLDGPRACAGGGRGPRRGEASTSRPSTSAPSCALARPRSQSSARAASSRSSRTACARSPTARGKAARRARSGRAIPDAYAAWSQDPALVSPPGGESAFSIAARALPCLVRARREHPNGNVMFVSHKATIRIIVCALLGVPLGRFRDRVACPTASLTTFEFGERGAMLRQARGREPPAVVGSSPGVASESRTRDTTPSLDGPWPADDGGMVAWGAAHRGIVTSCSAFAERSPRTPRPRWALALHLHPTPRPPAPQARGRRDASDRGGRSVKENQQAQRLSFTLPRPIEGVDGAIGLRGGGPGWGAGEEGGREM